MAVEQLSIPYRREIFPFGTRHTFGQFVAGCATKLLQIYEYVIFFMQKNSKDSLAAANGKDTQQIQQQFVEWILFESLVDCRNEPGSTL